MNDSLALVLGVFLLLFNGFFVAAEFAVISARRSQIEPRAAAGSRRARTTLLAMENVTFMIATAQVGITLCSVGLGAVAEPAVAHLLEPALVALGLPEALVHPVAFAVALTLVVSLHVVVGEMIPKNFAIALPDSAALLVVPALVAVSAVFRPVVFTLNAAANGVLRLLRITPRGEVASAFTLEEVRSVVTASQQEGTLDDESGVLSGTLGVTGLVVADLMLPLTELRTVPETVTPADVERLVAETGFSRFVVVGSGAAGASGAAGGGSLGAAAAEPLGYLHLKDVLDIAESDYDSPVPAERRRRLVSALADDPVERALAAMQRAGSHLARVDAGPTAPTGVLFLEDVIEEIVGEITDAGQRPAARRTRPAGASGSEMLPATSAGSRPATPTGTRAATGVS